MPIDITGTETGSHNLAILMTSSRRSYTKDLNEITMGYDYDEANDPTGPFNMCVISEYLVTDKNMNYTRGDILFCSAGMISDSVLEASNYLNAQFLEHAGCSAHVLVNRHIVVIEQDHNGFPTGSRGSQTLRGQTARQSAVADHGNYVVVLLQAAAGLGHS